MLSFQQLQEKKTKIKINPKKEEMMEKSDVIDSGTSTEELYDSQEEVVEESSEESETQTTLLTFEERAARKMTLRNLQTLKKKTIPAAKAAEAKRKKEGKGEYSAAYKKKETDVTNYDDKAPAKKAAPKKKAVASVKKATPKAAPKKSEPKAKAKPAPKKEAPRTQKGAMAYDGPNKARSQAADRVKAKTKAKQKSLPKKEAPKSKSVGDRVRDVIKKGVKRHKKAVQPARVFAKGFKKGVKDTVKFAGKAKKAVVGEGVISFKQFNEATRLKKEKGYDKGGTKKPSGKPTAMSVVLDKIRKEYGHGAVVGQGGSRQKKKEKGAKSSSGTGKYLKRAQDKKAYAAKAKKAGFKSTQSYTDTMARYGGEDNYKKGRGLGT